MLQKHDWPGRVHNALVPPIWNVMHFQDVAVLSLDFNYVCSWVSPIFCHLNLKNRGRRAERITVVIRTSGSSPYAKDGSKNIEKRRTNIVKDEENESMSGFLGVIVKIRGLQQHAFISLSSLV